MAERQSLISTDTAVTAAAFIETVPPWIRRPAGYIFNRLAPILTDTEEVAQVLLAQYAFFVDPKLYITVETTATQALPAKDILLQGAQNQLLFQARTSVVSERRSYPDLPKPPELLRYLPPEARVIEALSAPHLSFGFPYPPNLPKDDMRPVIDHPDIPGQRQEKNWLTRKGYYPRISFDQQVLRYLYPEGQTHQLEGKLYGLAAALMEKEIPQPGKEIVDRLRFLGLPSETEFVQTIEKALFGRIEAKGGDTTRLKQFMAFAKATDKVREAQEKEDVHQGKRRTGEPYYCHYLASTWFHWTMLEESIIHNGTDLAQAVEETELMIVHDILEDFDYSFEHQHTAGADRYHLSIPNISSDIGISSANTAILQQGVDLTTDQWLILHAITKEKRDDGADWLEKIRTITHPYDPSSDTARNLRIRAARCKAADRLSNLLTMTAAGGPYSDVVRKLDETIGSGGQLLWLGHMANQALKPLEMLALFRNPEFENQVEALLTSIPLIAEMEKRLLLIRFGQEFFSQINKSSDPMIKSVANRLNAAITRHDRGFYSQLAQRAGMGKDRWLPQLITIVRGETENARAIPPRSGRGNTLYVSPWLKRLIYLAAVHHPEPEVLQNVIPAEGLHNFAGLAHFVSNRQQTQRAGKPIEFKDIAAYVQDLLLFRRNMTPAYGILPGGVDDLFVPFAKNADSNALLHHSLQRMYEDQ